MRTHKSDYGIWRFSFEHSIYISVMENYYFFIFLFLSPYINLLLNIYLIRYYAYVPKRTEHTKLQINFYFISASCRQTWIRTYNISTSHISSDICSNMQQWKKANFSAPNSRFNSPTHRPASKNVRENVDRISFWLPVRRRKEVDGTGRRWRIK